ncbi:MAG: YbgC/FadM family acyl-CoA thioesterase [Bacteroidetes bacterium]|nr:YbgC/FadM family acyl-CoA thioesterase [Bacteroidota bacterium]
MLLFCVMAFYCSIPIRNYHCDAYGHVNNARYLELFEEARWQALDDSGVHKKALDAGFLFFVVHIDLTFKKPVLLNEVIRVESKLKHSSRRTLAFEQNILDEEGHSKTHAVITFVLFDPATEKSVPVSEEILNWFNGFN